MCTNSINTENDLLINELLYSQLSEIEKSNVKVYVSNKKVLEKIQTLKFAICYRYHAHILCIINNIPFISISNTPKVLSLLEENNLMDLNSNPIHFITKSKYILENKNLIIKKLKNVYKENNRNINIYSDFNKYIFDKSENTFFIDKKDYEIIYDYICMKYKNLKSYDLYFNTNIITFFLMKSINTIYTYGLNEKIFKGIENLRNDIYWLINDNVIHKNLIFFDNISEILKRKTTRNGLINLTFIDQNEYKGLHRSGWQYVIDNLMGLHSMDGILTDLYVDRTFHWNSYEYNKLGLIPYTRDWIGFIHHTCNTDYSTYNTCELFKNKLFIQSLKYCRGLILLTNDLKLKVDNLLKKYDINVNTYVIYHPTEFVSDDKLFTHKKFILNENKKIIQIGAWMRDINAINKLDLGKNNLYLNKYVLRGKKMESYYHDPDTDIDDKDDKNLNEIIMCRQNDNADINEDTNSNTSNKHIKIKLNKDINMISFLENDDYDNLIDKNIVFLKLEDASAVNTIIECVVRNTPVLVNRLPAVEEILGKKYPFFYETLDDVKDMLNIKLVDKTTDYIRNLNKNDLKIETFIDKFTNIVTDILYTYNTDSYV